jgi:hypothetical protein
VNLLVMAAAVAAVRRFFGCLVWRVVVNCGFSLVLGIRIFLEFCLSFVVIKIKLVKGVIRIRI